jgi:hypothetical protein
MRLFRTVIISSPPAASSPATPSTAGSFVIRILVLVLFLLFVFLLLFLVVFGRWRVFELGKRTEVGDLGVLGRNLAFLDQFGQLVFEDLQQTGGVGEDGSRRAVVDLGVVADAGDVVNEFFELLVRLFP